jgi:NAD(P)-dependent dehydrogenase (short-subunit alcohol dehydrogenase family)
MVCGTSSTGVQLMSESNPPDAATTESTTSADAGADIRRGEVVVITGAGGMGQAVARRLGGGRRIVLADFDDAALSRVSGELQSEGHDVHRVLVDVSAEADVAKLARAAGELGAIRGLVHTAGVSPVQATPEQIVEIDVIGTAMLLEAFEEHVRPGTVGICIASMAGTMTIIPAEVLQQLATTPARELRTLGVLDPANLDPGTAYGIAKRANQVRVEAASLSWGRRGGRVVSISPGIISTKMGAAELAGPFGDVMREMIAMSGCHRVGSPDDIAGVVEFLVSPAASFITGTDVRVDGGVVAATRYPRT